MKTLEDYIKDDYKIVNVQFDGLVGTELSFIYTLNKELESKIISVDVPSISSIFKTEIGTPIDGEFSIKKVGVHQWHNFNFDFFDHAPMISKALK